MWNDEQFMQQTMSFDSKFSQFSMHGVGISMKQLILWRSSIASSQDKEQFDACFPLEKFYEVFLKNRYKQDAIQFFEGELQHVMNLKPTTHNPLVLKMLEDQITIYSEAIMELNK
jgi:hypothetical protein